MSPLLVLSALLVGLAVGHHCVLRRPPNDITLFFEEPQERGTTSAACPIFTTTCCTGAGLAQAGGSASPMYLAVNAAMTNIEDGCQTALRQLFCAVCSPDQDAIFTPQSYETDMLVCPHFAASVLTACRNGVVGGAVVSTRFANDAASFLHAVLGESMHVSVRDNLACYDPTLRACTLSDYIGVYSDCVNGQRSAFFQRSPLANCQGGVANPAPITGLSCTIPCVSGTYLPVGTTQCQPCAAGTFSIGGGVHIETWKGWPHGISASDYCLGRYNRSEITGRACEHWTMDENMLMSGRIGDSTVTVVDLAFELIRPGHVSFRWMVDAELCAPPIECDGFYAELDGVKVVNLTSVQPWTYTRLAVPKGHHVLTLAYSKDVTLSKGSDMAAVDELEINGLDWADSSCTQCSPGSYSHEGARNCTLCPLNTFTDQAGTPDRCMPCLSSEYALIGATECLARRPCTEDDYEFLFSPCRDDHTQSRYATWITPHICGGGVSLPTATTNLPCFACPPGFRRLPGSGECVGCPNGHMLSGDECVPCHAGTFAHKVFEVRRWDEWPDWVHHQTGRPLTATLTHGCDGAGCQDEWRLMGNYIDSGVGHRYPSTTWLNFTVDVEAIPTYFTYNITYHNCSTLMECRSSLRVVRTSDGTVIDSDYTPMIFSGRRGLRILEPGFHSFLLTFDGGRGGGIARVHALRLSGARDGSAYECLACRNGTTSGEQQDFCPVCPAGTFARHGQASPCTPCTGNTVSFVAGSGNCTECGRGTRANAAHTECDTDCVFEADPLTKFNVQPLHNADTMYGPIYDPKHHQYYLSVCDRVPVNATPCVNADGDRVNSLLCQVTSEQTGVNIGDFLTFVPLPSPHQREGFNLTFTHGDVCGNGVVRSGAIAFLCDPEAGHGFPTVPHGHENVESSVCKYEFVWSTMYACPQCTEADFLEVTSSCLGGKQEVSYVWRERPKRCVGGADLPPNRMQDCSGSTTQCDPGQYAPVGQPCTAAPPGSYSIGNGEVVVVDSAIPLGFDNGCQGSKCTSWSVENGGTLKSGLQTSFLRAARTYAFDGTLRFTYKYSGGPLTQFQLRIDGDVVLTRKGQEDMFSFLPFQVDVPKGLHSFEWSYRGGARSTETDRGHFVLISQIAFVNSDYAPVAPIPCPGGFEQPESGQVSCKVCGENQWSGAGSVHCQSCSPEQWSLPGSRACKGRSPCRQESDYQFSYSPCRNGVTNMTWEPLQPVICYGAAPPAPTTQPCTDTDCPRGQGLRNGACVSCHAGAYFSPSDKECKGATPGNAAVLVKTYFEGFQTSSAFESGWDTSCNGVCGTAGWRARSHMMDSGFHDDNEVDSFVILRSTFLYNGYIEFFYTVDSDIDGLDFMIDGVRQKLFRPTDGGRERVVSGSARFPLTRGAHVFLWNYHQTEGHIGSVSVERIALTGVDGGGSELVHCPPGTSASANLASECTPCAPGHFSDTNGSSTCTMCPENEYQPLAGQTLCYPCPAGASTHKALGASFCTHSCIFSDPNSKRTWDLSTVSNTLVGPIVSPLAAGVPTQSYYLQFCQPITDVRVCNNSLGEAVPTYVCEVAPTSRYGVSAGTSIASSVTPNGELQLVYTGGSDEGCDAGGTRQTTVLVQCNPNAGLLDVRAELSLEMSCNRVFRVSALQGCRACSTVFAAGETSNGDYSRVVSECVGGVQNVTLVRTGVCSGPSSLTMSQTCESQLPVPYYGVAVVFGVVMLLGAIVLFLVFRNRRINQSYSQLLERHEGMQMGGLGGSGRSNTSGTSLVDPSVDAENVVNSSVDLESHPNTSNNDVL